ncbi:uncharacterized protein V6R79_025876 [Siganus canaliculatus]
MEALRFVVVLLLVVFVQVFSALGTPLSSEEEDGEVWTVENWQGFPLERGISIRLADLIKRSKAQQFHGLMGRSSGASEPVRLGRKRNKGEMFVGLMGKRTLDEGTRTRTRTHDIYLKLPEAHLPLLNCTPLYIVVIVVDNILSLFVALNR